MNFEDCVSLVEDVVETVGDNGTSGAPAVENCDGMEYEDRWSPPPAGNSKDLCSDLDKYVGNPVVSSVGFMIPDFETAAVKDAWYAPLDVGTE